VITVAAKNCCGALVFELLLGAGLYMFDIFKFL